MQDNGDACRRGTEFRFASSTLRTFVPQGADHGAAQGTAHGVAAGHAPAVLPATIAETRPFGLWSPTAVAACWMFLKKKQNVTNDAYTGRTEVVIKKVLLFLISRLMNDRDICFR